MFWSNSSVFEAWFPGLKTQIVNLQISSGFMSLLKSCFGADESTKEFFYLDLFWLVHTWLICWVSSVTAAIMIQFF